MILRRSSRTDPRLVLGSALAFVLPFGCRILPLRRVCSDTVEVVSRGDDCRARARRFQRRERARLPHRRKRPDALKQHDQELDAALAKQRESVENQAKLRSEIEALGSGPPQIQSRAHRHRRARARRRSQYRRDAGAPGAARRAGKSVLRKSLDERRDVIVEILAALQRIGHQPPPALLVRPEDALQAVRTRHHARRRGAGNARAGRRHCRRPRRSVRVRKEIVGERERLARELALLGREQLRHDVLIDERQKKQAATEQALDAERQRAADLAHQVDNLKDLIAKLESGLDTATRAAAPRPLDRAEDATRPDLAALKDPGRLAPAVAFAATRGHLRLPVNGVKIREFGASDGVGGTQKGLSIAARAGAQITSPCDGWVVYAGPFRSYGQLLILNAGGGYHVLLAGMERISVDLGQFVLTGEPVAVMGGGSQVSAAVATRSKQPVLYVEFRKDGAPIDPSPWWATNEGEKVRG